MKKPKYPNLVGEMARNGYTHVDIASEIGMKIATFRSRLCGETDFRLSEMIKIRNIIDRYMSIDFLFVKGTKYDKQVNHHYESCEIFEPCEE